MSLRTSNNSQKIKKYNKSRQQVKKYDISLLDTFERRKKCDFTIIKGVLFGNVLVDFVSIFKTFNKIWSLITTAIKNYFNSTPYKKSYR
jgi:hypothetical protein